MNYKKLVQPYTSEMFEKLNELLSINSEYDEKTITKEMPYGAGVDKALKYIGKLGEENGFSVDYCDGYCTELTFGEGEKLISIFAHTDVVPATGEWKKDPYSPYVEDGKLIARGSSDDKGPFMASFFAAKALKEAGLIKGYRLRLVVGGDEERGASCLDHYFNVLKRENPTYGFTPDANFPVVCGEKHITDFYPSLVVEIPHVKSIHGGIVTNAVCDKVSIETDGDQGFITYLKEQKIDFTQDGNCLTFLGKSAHGALPERGVNAALIALRTLGDFYKIESLSKLGNDLVDTTGEKFGCRLDSKYFGLATYCVGLIDYSENKLSFSVNFRFGENGNLQQILDKFNEHFGTISTCERATDMLLFEPNSKFIKTLMKAYRKESGDRKSKPLFIGGGTYAKCCKNTVAFGAEFPGTVANMHEPNEAMLVSEIEKCLSIYARAIDGLGKL